MSLCLIEVYYYFSSYFMLFVLLKNLKPKLKKFNSSKKKLENTSGAAHLKLLDSLERYIDYDEEFQYDSLVNYTIKYAISLDSLNKAGEYVANRIYHQNSILTNPEKGEEIYQDFKKYIPQLTSGKSITRLYLNVADSYYFLRNTERALQFYNKAAQTTEKYNLNHLLGFICLYRGQLQSDQGNFSKAVFDYQKAETLFEKEKDTFNIMSSLNSLAVIFAKNNFFNEAANYRKLSQVLAEKTKSYGSLIPLYYNAAEDFNIADNQAERIASLKKAAYYTNLSKYKEAMEPPVFAALAAAYADNDSLELAESYYKKLTNGPEYYRNPPNEMYFVIATLSMQQALGNYSEALTSAKKFEELALKNNSFLDRYLSKLKMANILNKLNRPAEANDYLIEYYKLKDSISSVKKIQSLAYYQTLYETEKKENLINTQKKDIDLLNAKSKLQKQLLIFSILISAGVLGLILLYRSRKTAKEKTKLQQDYSHKLLVAQEDERSRLARELHDSLGQKLVLLKRRLLDDKTEGIENLADESLKELRTITKNLHPANLDLFGFSEAVTIMIDEVDKNTTINFSKSIENVDDLLTKDRAIHLYRMIQESLNNMIKYSNTDSAELTILKKESSILIEISDAGDGFDTNSDIFNSGLGLKTLKERSKLIGSKLSILSDIGKGSSVKISIPV